MKHIAKSKVVKVNKLNSEYFILILKLDKKLDNIIPGQFLEVLIENYDKVFLRRPFSIHDVDYVNNTITILIKIVGNGTKYLSKIEENSYLDIIYPLGRGFTILKNKKVLLTGGGCGIAPLFYLSKILKDNNNDVNILLGARSGQDLFEIDEFSKLGKLNCITNDGTLGEKGLITEHSIFSNTLKFDLIYSCGPEIMMKNIAKIAKQAKVECEVSLENTMACGIGACLCCVTDTIDGNICVCTEGPVFNIKKLKWQI